MEEKHSNGESLHHMMDEVLLKRSVDPETVIGLCHEILAQSAGESMYGKAFGEYYFAEALYRLNKTDELMKHVINGLNVQKGFDFYELEAKSYNLLGVFFCNLGDLQTAINYFLLAKDIATTHQLQEMLTILYTNFGDVCLQLSDCEKAIYYFTHAKTLLDEHKNRMDANMNKEIVCNLYCNLIDAYLMNEQVAEALNISDELFENLSESYLIGTSSVFYSILTRLNYKKGKPSQGHSSALLFLKSVKEKTDFTKLSDVYLPMGEFFYEYGLMEELKELLDCLREKADDIMNPYQIVELSNLYVKYYQKMNEPRELFLAYEAYYEAVNSCQTSMREEKRKNMMIQMELHNSIQTQNVMQEKNRELEQMSEHDALTGLANRYSINKYCVQKFEDCCQKQQKFGVIICDIDYFKQYNDTYGHVEGDRCICEVARFLEEICKGLITVRFGGDEFLVLSSGFEDDELIAFGESICRGIEELHLKHQGSKSFDHVTVSCGVVNREPKETESIVDFIRMADNALYKIKKSKRNAIGFYAD